MAVYVRDPDRRERKRKNSILSRLLVHQQTANAKSERKTAKKSFFCIKQMFKLIDDLRSTIFLQSRSVSCEFFKLILSVT